MNDETRPSRVETRRRLLKGALAASSVMSMGAGATALTSVSCVAKVRTDGGYPAGSARFSLGANPPPSSTTYPAKWGWRRVVVNRYLYNQKYIDAFDIGGTVYKTAAPETALTGAILQSASGYPKDGWVLAHFDDKGFPVSSYPHPGAGTEGATPAAKSCATSLNPGAESGDIRFSG